MTNGFIYEQEHEKDFPVCMVYEDADEVIIPESFTTSFQPPYARQISGNCVAQTIANIMEVMYYNMTGKHEDFSVGFVYGNREPNEYSGEGMTGYLACSHLVNDGDVKSAVFDNPGSAPSIIEVVNKFKTSNPDWREKAYIPKMYVRTKKADEVKRFILKYNIPVMGITWSKNIGKILGGNYLHAMALYGWEGNKAIFQNSWGEDDANKIVKIDFDKCEEFWLIKPFEIANFKDISTQHWAYKAILKCAENDILIGYPDNTFKPNRQMTRAEFCAMIYRLMKEMKKI